MEMRCCMLEYGFKMLLFLLFSHLSLSWRSHKAEFVRAGVRLQAVQGIFVTFWSGIFAKDKVLRTSTYIILNLVSETGLQQATVVKSKEKKKHNRGGHVCTCVPLSDKPAMPTFLPTGHRIPPSAGSADPLPGQCHQHDSPLEGADREKGPAVTHTHTHTQWYMLHSSHEHDWPLCWGQTWIHTHSMRTKCGESHL